jgi:PST family polysaccharide transporter
VSGVAWRSAGQIAQQVSSVITSIVLARLVGPKEYGLVTMATVAIGFAALFDDFGMDAALVRTRNIDDVQRSSVFWFSLAIGTVLAVLTAASGILLARFYHEPALAKLTPVLALRFPLAAIAFVHRAELERALEFRILARIGFVSFALGGVIGIVLAACGAGAWSLVLQDTSSTTLFTLQLWAVVRWRPRLVYRQESLSGLLRFGLYLMAVDINAYVTRNLDNVLVGRFYGKTTLALYNRAYSFIYLPLLPARTVATVLFPAVAHLGDDIDRLRRAFFRAVGVIALVTWPAVVGVVVTADPFVRVVFGRQWIDMIPLLRLLAPVALWQSVGALHQLVFQARGRTDQQFRTNFVGGILSVIGISAGVHWGPRGVAIGYLIASAAAVALNLHYALLHVQATLLDVARALWKLALCCVVMAAAVTTLLLVVPPQWSPALRLSLSVPLGAIVYVLCVVTTRPAAWDDFREALRSVSSRAPSRQAKIRGS